MRKLDNWLDSWMQYTENTEPAELFRLWVGLGTVCACLRRKCYLVWDNRIYPNMYVVLVGPSASRKGTAMRPGYEMLSELGIQMSAEATTREALIRSLKLSLDNSHGEGAGVKRVTIHSSLTVFSEELVVFLGWGNMGLISDLTDWYDCKDNWRYETKTQGKDEITGVWVNLIGATTPKLLASALPDDAVGGGLVSRLMLVYAPGPEKMIPLPTRDMDLKKALLHDLEAIMQLQGEFKFSPGFFGRYSEWYMQEAGETEIDHPSFDGYNGRRATHLRKICMALSAARSNDMVITEKDLERGIEILYATERRMPEAFSIRGKNPINEVLQHVMQRIQLSRKIRIGDLMAKFINDLDSQQLDRIIQTLVQMKFARVIVSGKQHYIEYIPKEKRNELPPDN